MDHGTLLIQLKMILCTRLMYSFKLLENEPKKKKESLSLYWGRIKQKRQLPFVLRFNQCSNARQGVALACV